MTQTEQKSTTARGAKPPVQSCPRIGNWELDSLVAEGDWSRIYRARPAGASPDAPAAYALKMLRPDREADVAAIRLLAREALAGRSVSHPHLIAVLDSQIGRTPRFVVTPWLVGSTVASRLKRGPSLDVPAALWIARQVAEALQALDAEGWMHGDIKPSNVLLTREGHATVLDLGFARRRDEMLTLDEQFLTGTGYYLAPEYFTATLRPDIRSDLYSLGVMLYELLACRLPLHGESLAELAVRHKQTSPPNLRRVAPHVPDDAVRLVHQMLAKDPFRRPQTPAEVVDRLVRLEIGTFTERAAA